MLLMLRGKLQVRPGKGFVLVQAAGAALIVAAGGARCGPALGAPEKSGPLAQHGYGATAIRAMRT
jgi:hypothetical protein